MADLEFFFDTVCPWAWITSRWVTEVQAQRTYEVDWRFISLAMINEHRSDDWYTPEYRAGHMAGLHAHRVCDEVRLQEGNGAVGALYTEIGTAIHKERRRPEIVAGPEAFFSEMLGRAGLPTAYAAHVFDESHDDAIRACTDEALERTGRDVGTPILTFHPGTDREGSYFGPVISTIPRGAEATALWDAIEVLATNGLVAELKRSRRAKPVFD